MELWKTSILKKLILNFLKLFIYLWPTFEYWVRIYCVGTYNCTNGRLNNSSASWFLTQKRQREIYE